MIASRFAWALLLAAAGGEGGGPLEWRSDLALWTAVVFLCLLAILWKFAWKPIAEGLDNRERNIAQEIAQAEAANQKAREILADYQRKLAAAEDQVRAIVDQGRRDAERAGHELIDQGEGGRQGGISAGRETDRRRHGRRDQRPGQSERDAGRRIGRQNRPRPAQPP